MLDALMSFFNGSFFPCKVLATEANAQAVIRLLWAGMKIRVVEMRKVIPGKGGL